MNIKDFEIPVPPGDKLQLIFDHQLTLLHKYHDIEEKNLGHNIPAFVPLNLHHPASQQRLKDFAWRITEELAEATECLIPVGTDEVHYLEEMVDALHFTIELNHLSGVISSDLVPHPKDSGDWLEQLWSVLEISDIKTWIWAGIPVTDHAIHPVIRMISWITVEKLGTAMNCLKNKPWKSTHMPTDVNEYRKKIIEFNHRFFVLLKISGFEPLTLTQSYLNKNAVNQFRIRSNY